MGLICAALTTTHCAAFTTTHCAAHHRTCRALLQGGGAPLLSRSLRSLSSQLATINTALAPPPHLPALLQSLLLALETEGGPSVVRALGTAAPAVVGGLVQLLQGLAQCTSTPVAATPYHAPAAAWAALRCLESILAREVTFTLSSGHISNTVHAAGALMQPLLAAAAGVGAARGLQGGWRACVCVCVCARARTRACVRA